MPVTKTEHKSSGSRNPPSGGRGAAQDSLDYTLFSWSKQKGIAPIAVKYGEGVYMYDYDGKRYIDFSSGLMNVNIGHGDQRITEAVVRQMREISYVTPSCVTKVRGDLGKKLAEICPGDLNKAFFTLCGATSMENAIKLARMSTGGQQRCGIAARGRGGYCGAFWQPVCGRLGRCQTHH